MEQGPPLYFEDVDLGDEIGPLDKTPTDDAVEAFCDLAGTPVPNRFVHPEEAKRLGLPGPIVPGTMSAAMMSQLFTSWAPTATLKKIDVIFRRPVLHGPIRIAAVVADKRVEGVEHLVECHVYISSQDGDLSVGGKAIIALPSRGE